LLIIKKNSTKPEQGLNEKEEISALNAAIPLFY